MIIQKTCFECIIATALFLFPILLNAQVNTPFTSTSFGPQANLAAGAGPTMSAIGDFDSDGLPDLVVVNSYGNPVYMPGTSDVSRYIYTASVFRDISTIGNIAYSPKQDYQIGIQSIYGIEPTSFSGTGAVNPVSIAIADVNADNKPDIIILGSKAGVSILQNTSSQGAISFSAFISYISGYGSNGNTGTYHGVNTGLAVEDMDGDGKKDITVTSYFHDPYGTPSNFGGIMILWNSGINNTISFDETLINVSFSNTSHPDGSSSYSNNPLSIAEADFDSDGIKDIAITDGDYPGNGNATMVRVFKSSGMYINSVDHKKYISFSSGSGAEVDINTIGSANLSLGDINNDGLTDLLTGGIFNLNTSTGGVITFGGSNNIGSLNLSTVGDLNNDGRQDYVGGGATIYRNTSISNNSISAASFPSGITYTLGTGNILLADLDGDGKKDIIQANINTGMLSILRNRLNEPVITSFSPVAALSGTSVTITGVNLSGVTAVSFGGVAAVGLTVLNSTTVTAVVGAGATGSVSVTSPLGTGSLAGFTLLVPPVITSFTPTSVGRGLTVTISGTNFTNVTAVSFGSVPATSFNTLNSTTIAAVVGIGANGNVSVTTPAGTTSLGGFTFNTPPAIATTAPIANSITSSAAIVGGDIIVSGDDPIVNKGVVYNTTGNPTVADHVVNALGGRPLNTAIVTSGTGPFSVNLTGLNGSTTYYVRAYASNGASAAYGDQISFTTLADPPTVSSFDPIIAAAGMEVNIYGTHLTGTTAVSFGGTAATTITNLNDVYIRAVVPAGALSGSISVTTPGGTATLAGFTYCTPVVPSVTISSDQTGPFCEGKKVTFTAAATNGGSNPHYYWNKNYQAVGTNSNVYEDSTLSNNDSVWCQMNPGNDICVTVSYANSNKLKFNVNSAHGWTELGIDNYSLNANDTIKTMVIGKTGSLYAAGSFTDANGKKYVAEWNGHQWSAVGKDNFSLNANGSINSLATDDMGNIYAAGNFTNSSGKQYVAKWDGTNWTELGGLNALAANGAILKLLADANNNIYAAGWFKNNNGSFYVAKWNGISWTETGNNFDSYNYPVHILTKDKFGNIYAAGSSFYDYAGRSHFPYTDSFFVAKWNGIEWQQLGCAGTTDLPATYSPDQFINGYNSTNSYINSLVTDTAGNLFAMMEKFTIDPAPIIFSIPDFAGEDYFVKWNGNTWERQTTYGRYFTSSILTIDNANTTYSIENDYSTDAGYQWVRRRSGVNEYWSNGSLGYGYNGMLNTNSKGNAITTDSSGNLYVAGSFTNSNGHQYVAKYGLLAPVINITSTADTVCSKTRVTFTASASSIGTNIIYQWKKNGNNTGTNSIQFIDSVWNDHDTIWCMASSNIVCANTLTSKSNPIVMTVKSQPVLAITPAVDTLCGGGVPLNLTAAVVSGGNPPNYQLSGTAIPGSLTGYNGTSSKICDCPPGYVAVGYHGGAGAWMDVMGLICKKLNADGTLDNTLVYTDTAGAASTDPNGSINSGDLTTAGDNALTGMVFTENQYTSFGNFMSSAHGISLPISAIAMSQNSPTNFISQLGPDGLPLGTVNVPPGNVIVGMTGTAGISQVTTNTYLTGIILRYAPLINTTVNGTLVWSTGQTINSIVVTPANGNNVYTATYSQPGSCPAAAQSTITVYPILTPTITISVTPGTAIADGTTATYTATITNGGTAPIYQWNKNGINVGNNSNIYVDNTIVNGDTISCILTSSIAKCLTSLNAASNKIVMSVNSGTISFCPGAGTTIASNLIGTTYQWQLNSGSGFANIADGINYTGTNTYSLQINNTQSSWYNYQYRCVVNGSFSSTVTLKIADTWHGAVNNNWENNLNWNCNTIPDANTDVYINSGTVIINSDATCRSLFTKPGATLVIMPGVHLTITH